MNDDERIARLEARLAQAEARIATLEARSAPSTITITPFPDPGGTTRPPWISPFTYDTYNEAKSDGRP